ncbi:MAG: histidine kinase [Pseudomonadota bacterium]
MDDAHEQGLQQGLEQGLQQGREEEKREIVKQLLKTDLPIEQIAKVTGFSAEVLRQLLNQFENSYV